MLITESFLRVAALASLTLEVTATRHRHARSITHKHVRSNEYRIDRTKFYPASGISNQREDSLILEQKKQVASALNLNVKFSDPPPAPGAPLPVPIVGNPSAALLGDQGPGPELMPDGFNRMRIAKSEILPPLINKSAKRVRHYIGPIIVPGQEELERTGPTITYEYENGNRTETIHNEGVMYMESLQNLCSDCTVLAAQADLHFLNGTRVTIGHGIYNHHVVILDMNKILLPWYLCEGQTGYGRVFTSGFMITGVAEIRNRFTTNDSKLKSGYYIPKENNFMMNAELVNYRQENTALYVTTDVEYLDGKQKDWMDASMSLLSVTGCAPPDFQPPPNTTQYNMTSPKAKIPLDGYIIGSSGHVHDGGTNILLTLNDKIICDSHATYGGDNATLSNGKRWETILSMSECNEPVKVKAGDMLSTTAIYDTTKHPLRQAAHGHGDGDSMGTFFINFASQGDMFHQLLGAAASLLTSKDGVPLDLSSISTTLSGLDPVGLAELTGLNPQALGTALAGLGISL